MRRNTSLPNACASARPLAGTWGEQVLKGVHWEVERQGARGEVLIGKRVLKMGASLASLQREHRGKGSMTGFRIDSA